MQNIDIKADGNKLIITIIDVTKLGGPSASGKTISVASTHGNVAVPHPKQLALKIGINAYIPNKGA